VLPIFGTVDNGKAAETEHLEEAIASMQHTISLIPLLFVIAWARALADPAGGPLASIGCSTDATVPLP
jgi:hypothetical protein